MMHVRYGAREDDTSYPATAALATRAGPCHAGGMASTGAWRRVPEQRQLLPPPSGPPQQ